MELPVEGQPEGVAAAQAARANLTAWVGAAANLAALVGLIFVAVQIRQNTGAQRAAAYQAWLGTNAQLNMALSGGELSRTIATGHLHPEKLTADNNIAYAMWVMSFMQMVQATDYLYRQGVVDRSLWDTEIQRAAGHLNLPGVRQWWDAGGKSQLTPGFVALVERTTPTQMRWGWDSVVGFKQMPTNR